MITGWTVQRARQKLNSVGDAAESITLHCWARLFGRENQNNIRSLTLGSRTPRQAHVQVKQVIRENGIPYQRISCEACYRNQKPMQGVTASLATVPFLWQPECQPWHHMKNPVTQLCTMHARMHINSPPFPQDPATVILHVRHLLYLS